MLKSPVLKKTACYHCGDDCLTTDYQIEDKTFCCHGCKSVYEILSADNLCSYYSYNEHPGATRGRTDKRFDYLSDPTIAAELIDYQDRHISIVTFYIPHIHCSSCLWLLEKLNKINPAVQYCRVDFLKKQLNIRYDHERMNLQQLVELLDSIGYEPVISLHDVIKKQNTADKDNLVSKIAVAGFCFGNVMLLSFPEYFGLSGLEQTFRHFFGWLNILFSLPIVLYSGTGYFVSAWQNLKNKVLNIDFPLALGIAVLFGRTVIEILTHSGAGFADTLCGLVFFLLVGKFVQRKTYHHISFERDYRSFFPVAVHVIENGREKPLPLSALNIGNRMVIRNNEIIPADAILLKGEALIDFSFVTGEAIPVNKTLGEIIYAGGRQTGEAIELEVVKPVSQSYLTQLWNNEAFARTRDKRMQTFNERVSKYFTIVLLSIAFATLIFWLPTDAKRGLAAFTAVLIVACPCALALSTPFTMSAALSIFDRNHFYLKNTAVVEQLAAIDTIVMDKTGTITLGAADNIKLEADLTDYQKQLVYTLCSNSNHPLSRMICQYISNPAKLQIWGYREIAANGLTAIVDNHGVKIGNAQFVLDCTEQPSTKTKVHLVIDEKYLGYFSFSHQYREGMSDVTALADNYDLYLLSGDLDHERRELERFFPKANSMYFNQSPQSKLDFIQALQQAGNTVMMIGDGLNDAGALKQSDLGIAITDNVNNFSPGSDAILDGRSFDKLPAFLRFSKDTVAIIHCSFLISLTYNLAGLSYAVTGNLSPLTAAVLMPLSTVTIISFTSLATRFTAKRRKLI
ncbi:heavy metal translocating P-type ATPase metal-binding domain-containing protein [Mucilaginibacter sp. UR6-11]|uniref:heavy metal translocating P-type ATPase n=1 Tax=Mucilaginibacter sp. UR6-11 TaxID=1435644 RepID=UPI001E446D80|nr:heavy metal translocating P-type ATPase metal-binding domain-containing protein [Mucilaginibacter sp. UR6-11]MCC8425350.1 heavy metal translocating P-type ATPase metal-binding domain-containing protein [Mucilaginibacter sp. UR6-11]